MNVWELQQMAQDEANRRAGKRDIMGALGRKFTGLTEESASAKNQRADLDETGQAANQFAEYNQGGYQALTGEAAAQRDLLRRQAMGQDSLSAEQLRQGLQQNLASQRSMAASATPGNSAMAARNAAMNMGRAASGMSGAAATAGIQERRAAQEALAQMILQQRGQDLQGALGSRQTAVGAYGGINPEGTKLDKFTPWIKAASDGAAAYGALGKTKPGGR